MYKTLWNHIKKNTKKHTTASVFLPVLVLGWTVIGLLAGALICPFLQVAVLVKATVVLCTGGYAGLIFGFFGGIFYIYRGTVKKCQFSTVHFLQIRQQNTPASCPLWQLFYCPHVKKKNHQ